MIPFLVSFLASIAGAICGIGGGVIIKPVLDMFQVDSVASISFLSSCTVLSMSLYSFAKSVFSKEHSFCTRTVTPLALGAAIGGILGKYGFQFLSHAVANSSAVGAVQSACLAAITFATFLYTLNKSRISTLNTSSITASVIIGLFLGILSSFLGIGGGPINLIVLYFFFSMDTKTAASSSLYIILFSQLASLALTFVTNTVPSFDMSTLVMMILGGIGGGIIGRAVNKKITSAAVDKLFLSLIVLIICISLYNLFKYAST